MDPNCKFDFPYQVVLAHGPGCNDGATASWCVWRLLPQSYRILLAKEGGFYAKPDPPKPEDPTANDDEPLPIDPFLHPNSPQGAMRLQSKGFPVVFVFVPPGECVPSKLIEDKNVIILDLDMGDALVDVVRSASSVLLCDHHDSTPLTISKHSAFLYEKSRHKFFTYVNTSKSECGSTLAWRLTHTANIPPLVQIVRIGDTWQWDDYPELQARYVLKSLYLRRSFRSFPDIENTFSNWVENFEFHVQKGRTVLEIESSLIKQTAKQCDLAFIQTNDNTVYTVAYVQANILQSEVGSAMKWYAEKRFNTPIHFCATWKYASYKDIVSVSLRDPSPGINLAAVARTIKGSNGKGGGHDSAAGFSFDGIANLHKFFQKISPVQPQLSSN
jgi:oligoribonuclease NrnB/cAMP/cGMP phosphodiesterase (DHH superfamily)